jgi:hypothetical protein
MAAIALLLLPVTIDRRRMTAEEEIYHEKASDQESFAETKRARVAQMELGEELIGKMTSKELSERTRAQYARSIERYRKETAEISAEALKDQETEFLLHRKATRLYWAEALLEFAILVCSAVILLRHALLWYAALVSALGGAALSLMTWLS